MAPTSLLISSWCFDQENSASLLEALADAGVLDIMTVMISLRTPLLSGYTLEVCHIPCPLDCKLSDWSPWSSCSASCGSGLKTRSKWLREKAFNGGRPCPRLDLKNQVRPAVGRRCMWSVVRCLWSHGGMWTLWCLLHQKVEVIQ